MNDSGKRKTNNAGAMREPDFGKGAWELLTPYGLSRVAIWYELGARKYNRRNWEKGVSVNRCFRSLLRHAFKYIAGWQDEDHLAAVVWNALAIMHFEQILHHIPKEFEWDLETRNPDSDSWVQETRKYYPYMGISLEPDNLDPNGSTSVI